MAKTELTGIERQFVLSSLVSESVPLTIELSEGEKNAVVFPVAVRAEQVKVLEKGIALVQNVGNSLSSFIGKQVRIQFYFNKLALYFETTAQASSAGIALVIPPVISKIVDVKDEVPHAFSATIFYEAFSRNGTEKRQKTDILCFGEENFPLLVSSDYKEVADRYLSSPPKEKVEAILGRVHAPTVIYLDSHRVLFGSKKNDMPLSIGAEYAVCLRFPISGPIKERAVYISCRVDEMYENFDCNRLCACTKISSIREEDERFLSDKMHVSRA